MRGINKLSDRRIKSDLPRGRYGDGGGLWLEVRDGKRWVFLYRFEGRSRSMGLGPLRDVSLARARELARECRQNLADRIDPITRRNEGPRAVPTFGVVADAYIDSMAPQFRNLKHLAQWRMTLGDTYCRALRAKRIDAIGTEDVLATLRPVWLVKPETAGRIRGRIERVIDAARAQGLRTGENPARWRGHLDHLLPRRPRMSRGHFRALPVGDLPGFLVRLRASQTVSARALEFVILTAARTGEAIGARWEEIDGDLWTVPGARMKAGRDHRVPLTPRALDILEEMRAFGSAWVFPGLRRARPLSNMAMLELLKDLAVPVTVHGFRSTFRDWAGDYTSHPREVIEAALAHVVGDRVEAAYRRGDALDRRRSLMLAWESYCLPKSGSNVVRLSG